MKHDLEFRIEEEPSAVLFNGRSLPLAPFERQMLKRLYDKGKVRFNEFPAASQGYKAVTISKLRRVLSQFGVPYTIPHAWGDDAWTLKKVNGG